MQEMGVVGQGGGCGDGGKGSCLGHEIHRMDVVTDELPRKAAMKGKVLDGQSGWGGRGRGARGPAHPCPQAAGVRLRATGMFCLQVVGSQSWPVMLRAQESQAPGLRSWWRTGPGPGWAEAGQRHGCGKRLSSGHPADGAGLQEMTVEGLGPSGGTEIK